MKTPVVKAILFIATVIAVAVLSSLAATPVLGTVFQFDVATTTTSTIGVADAVSVHAPKPTTTIAVADSVALLAPSSTTTVSITETTTLSLGPLPPLTTTVNTTKDGFDGRCDEFHCSLRERITEVNPAGGADTVTFNIPTSTDPGYDAATGVFTLELLTPLPNIAGGVTIDGFSQPGASPNTLAGGNNAVLRIELDGSQVVASAGERIGIHLTGAGGTVKGLIINGFAEAGIVLDSNGGHKVEGNVIGLDADGVTPIGNGVGVDYRSVSLDTIGGDTPAKRNVISGPGTAGVRLAAGFGAVVQGNFIGTNQSGTGVVNNGAAVGVLIDGTTGNGVLDSYSGSPSMPNVIGGWGTAGVHIVNGATGNFVAGNMIGTDLGGTLNFGNAMGVLINAPGNQVGGDVSTQRNVIAYNTGDGVRVQDGAGNLVRLNSFYDNGGLAVDLGGDGVTPNDAGDADGSPNGFQNFPVLLEVNSLTGNATGTLDSTTSTEFQIDFYTNGTCDPSGFGEGRTVLGGVTVTTSATGTVTFTANLDRTKFTAFLTAQAKDSNDNSSELSACLAIPDPTIVVDDTADAVDANPGDGLCADSQGRCTLRAAIMEANTLSGSDVISVPAGTYLLDVEGSGEDGSASGDLDVVGVLTILGAGSGKTIIDANKGTAIDPDRVFHVLTDAVLTIKDLTFQNGEASNGGGLYNNKGSVTLERVVVANNNGDGLYNGSFNGDDATMTITDSTIRNNTGDAVELRGSHCCSPGAGYSTVTLLRSTIRDNSNGLALSHQHAFVRAYVINSTLAYNGADAVENNPSNSGYSRVYISHSTIVGHSRGLATGSASDGGVDRITIKNSILADNNTNCSGSEATPHELLSAGHNISDDGSCAMFDEPGDVNDTDPLLGELADNAGITDSFALLPGSPAIDAVTSTGCTDTNGDPVTDDQRAFGRPLAASCDLGSYEFGGGSVPGGPVVVGSGKGTVTPAAGGSVDAGEGDVVTASIAVLPGAVSSTVDIGIKSFDSSDPALPALADGTQSQNVLGRAFEFSPEGTQFSSSTTIATSYTQAHLDGRELIEGSIYPLLLDGGQWVKVDDCLSQGPPSPDPCVVSHDINANTLTIETTHFSTYAFEGVILSDTLFVTSDLDTVDATPGDGICADASGVCTLRAAIIEANANANVSNISLPAGTYALTIDGSGEDASAIGDLDVTSGLTITGAGSDVTTIDGNKGVVNDHVINVKTGATLTTTGVTIANGDRKGLYNQGGTLILDGVVVRNHDEYGIDNERSGATASLTVRNSTIRNNGSSGVYTHSGTGFAGSTIVNSTVRNNSSYGIYISNSNSTAQAVVINSTISNNSSYAIRLSPANSGSSRAFLSHTTVADNVNGIRPGSASDSGSSKYELKNTILTNNGSDNCISGTSATHPIVSLGHNISSDNGCSMLVQTGDLQNTDPLLGPRQDNGGLTETFGLTIGSPAIDAVPLAECSDTGGTPITTDQRNRARPAGAACDIGAVEFSDAGMAVNPMVVYQGLDFDSTLVLTFTVSSTGLLPLNWSVTEDAPVGWLMATPTSSTVPTSTAQTVQVALDTTGLAAGRYQTTLQFDSNTPQAPIRVPLLLCVPFPCGPAESPWPMFRRNALHSGRSDVAGPNNVIEKWSFATGAGISLSSPSIGPDGTIYVGAGDQKLYAVNPDGTFKWSFPMGGSIVGSPAVAGDGTVYLAARDRGLYAVRPDGTEKWRVSLSGSIDSPATIGPGGTIYLPQCGSGSDLRAYDVDGNQLWSLDPPASCKTDAAAIALDGTLYFGAWDGSLNAVEPDGSALKWTYTTGDIIGYSSPAIGPDGAIYIGSRDDKLHAVNPDGSPRWTFTTGGDINSSPAVGADSTVYVGSDDNTFYAVNPSGTLKWSFTSTAGFGWSHATIDANGAVYIGSDDNNLYAFNPDGSLKWSFAAGDKVRSGPVIGADGTLYFGSLDAKLYALAPVPEIDVVPASIEVSIPPNATATASVTVSNAGASLDWTLTQDPLVEWLSATPTSGTLSSAAFQEVTVTFDSSGLAFGSHTTTLSVTSTDPNKPQVDVAVTLHAIPSATAWGLVLLAALFSAGLVLARRRSTARP